MKKRNLLQRAGYDFRCALLGLQHYSGDEFELDIVAYHVQQTIEKLMKWELEKVGARFSFTHEVHILYQEMLDAGLCPGEWIINHYAVINDYATKTRYGENLVAVKAVLDVVLANTDTYLQQQEELERQELEESNEPKEPEERHKQPGFNVF